MENKTILKDNVNNQKIKDKYIRGYRLNTPFYNIYNIYNYISEDKLNEILKPFIKPMDNNGLLNQWIIMDNNG